MTRTKGSALRVEVDGASIPAVLWTPSDASGPVPVVLAGHGFLLHKRALFPATIVGDLTSRGLALLALDAPAHGDRQPDGGRDREAVDAAWRAHWRAHAASKIAEEYAAAIDALDGVDSVDTTRVGYWGLSLATQYGVGVLANEPRIRAAVLGLFGLVGPRVAAYAAAVACPVFFIQQLEDEIHDADSVRALFDRIGSAEKTLVASPGLHQEVPGAVFEQAYAWLEERLTS